MAAFEPAVSLVLRHEGGYVWNKNDPGGPTNYGVTQAVYQAFATANASPGVKVTITPEQVQAMSVGTAQMIYRANYWQAIRGDQIASQDVANWLLDMSVLRGVSGASVSMQQALGVTADGVLGAKTIAALNANTPAQILNVFRSLCVKAFGNIVTRRPASVEFLNNWLKRAEEMTETISLLQQKSAAQVSPAV